MATITKKENERYLRLLKGQERKGLFEKVMQLDYNAQLAWKRAVGLRVHISAISLYNILAGWTPQRCAEETKKLQA